MAKGGRSWPLPKFVTYDPIENDVNCYTDGSKLYALAGAGIVVRINTGDPGHKDAFHLGKYRTVLHAKVLAVEKTATFLLYNKIRKS